jgi:hypothetical protein
MSFKLKYDILKSISHINRITITIPRPLIIIYLGLQEPLQLLIFMLFSFVLAL